MLERPADSTRNIITTGAPRLFFHISDLAGDVEPASGDACCGASANHAFAPITQSNFSCGTLICAVDLYSITSAARQITPCHAGARNWD